MSECVEKKWIDYIKSRNPKLRDQLVIQYQPLVYYVAKGFQRGNEHTGVLEWDDLISAGMLGLLDAIDRFDPERNIKFETYAILRIRGAILDTLRSIDWAPRNTRKKIKKVMNTMAELQNQLKRNPTEVEISSALNISVDEYRKVLDEMTLTRFISLQDLIVLNNDDKVTREKLIHDTGIDDDYHDSNDDLRDVITHALENMPAKERLLLVLYYYEGLNMSEIASVLNITESRVSQLNSQALIRLKVLLTEKYSYAA